jgi:hypothetical protein
MAITMGWMSKHLQASSWPVQRIMSKPALRPTQLSVQQIPVAGGMNLTTTKGVLLQEEQGL